MTNPHVVPISDAQLALSALLVLISGGVAAFFRLGLLKSLLWGTVRCVVQLSLVGYALAWIFAVDRPELVVVIIGVMCAVAASTATRRTPNVQDFPVMIAFVSLAASTYLIMVIVSGVIIRAEPWYTARIVIPISGMILGNAVSGIALSIDRLYSEVRSRRDEVEAMLSLGATPWEAVQDCVREAIRSGMTPVINSIMVVGLVSLPGMMTGQILGGADPAEAARYQIVVMLMIAAASALGSMLLVGLSFRRLYTRDDALKPELSHSK
ncbi:MAG: iron export ABC transporter permease subunit FetB [Desulfomonile tiedjei]|uniref:Iron export ABC transporter permease subunit FetB n=1 Tax=Desulfomonile tiedjei TaxID=2358 RepID=A0A9D6V1D1_9BACT|nr:iron export ABC transporter permease subunit FetB [Desulfomonile tiedjei]